MSEYDDIDRQREVDKVLAEARAQDPNRPLKVRLLVLVVAVAVMFILGYGLPIGMFVLVCVLIFGAGFALVRSERSAVRAETVRKLEGSTGL